MNSTTKLEPLAVQWRMLAVGSQVWSPRSGGWAPATVVSLGKNRGERTIVHLAFHTGGQGRRVAGELFWRKPELKGKDKPPKIVPILSPMDAQLAAASEMIEHEHETEKRQQ